MGRLRPVILSQITYHTRIRNWTWYIVTICLSVSPGHKNTPIALKIHETRVCLYVVLLLWHHCCPKQYGCRKSSNYISKWKVILFVQFCTRGLNCSFKSSRRWAEVSKEELINAPTSVIRKSVWRLRRRLLNNIEMILEYARGVIVNWINLFRDRLHWRTALITIITNWFRHSEIRL